jgi:transposase
MKGYMIMSQKEAFRYDTIQDLINGKINATVASKKLDLTTRHIRRMKKRVLKDGIKGIIHKNRGKPSNRRLSKETINEIKRIISKNYPDFKPTFACEKLEEKHDIKISSETLRQIMIKLGLWKPKKRKINKQYRTWRLRKEYFGEMEQFDGCYHFWFEDRYGEVCLLLSIDDATGEITHAKFDKNEGTIAVFKFWKEYFQKNGLPLSIYLDKFSTYKINHKNAVDNSELMTQFQRAMKQLGVNLITANSPEAKGRVERVFATLQDRLVKELRLANISNIEEGNKFLKKYIPQFNAKFSVNAVKKENLHKEIKCRLNNILNIQNQRLVQNDFTVRYKNRWFQLNEIQPTAVFKKDKVIIEERLDESLKIKLRDKYLSYQELPKRPRKILNLKLSAITTTKTQWTPPKNHPWRRSIISKQQISINNH